MKRIDIQKKLFLFPLLTGLLIITAGKDDNRLHVIQKNELEVIFYNVENLFDTIDSGLDDNEFLPLSPRRWNSYKYKKKLNNLFKAIVLCGSDMMPPDIIGLCEVENVGVLRDLCEKTYLHRDGYSYLISTGNDERGINTALLFRKERLRLISTASWCPVNDDGSVMHTRAVLHSRFKYYNDTLDIIVCHWPSRRGGAIESEIRRKIVASFIKVKADSLGPDRKIIIMGDLNDEPGSASVHEVLNAIQEGKETNGCLINTHSGDLPGYGSYKYQGTWYHFDQIIISPSLYLADDGTYYKKHSFRIVFESSLLTEDDSYKGMQPYSTYRGYNYTGGFSDHLPVAITLERR